MFALVKPDEPSGAEPAADAAVPAAEDATDDAADGGPDPECSAEECDSDDVYGDVMRSYMWKRNVINDEIADPFFTNKAIIEYINLKFIDNNCRSVGLNKIFDEYNLTQAHLEFKSFEKWFTGLRKYIAERIHNQDLCLPLFCHLYLNLYSENEHENFLTFLDIFKHLFVCSKGVLFLRELKNVVDMNNLPPYLSLFRKNKIVLKTSPEFLTRLYYFFQHHFLLKAVFQEWFDVNYSSNLDPLIILHSYFIKSINYIPRLNDRVEKHFSINHLSKEVIQYDNNAQSLPNNSSPKRSSVQEQVSNSKENLQNRSKINKLSGRQKLSNNGMSSSESSFEDCSVDSLSESSFSDEEILMQKFFKSKLNPIRGSSFKTSYYLKTTPITKIDPVSLDEDSLLCTTRQISLINCNKLSCSILTSDGKHVAAGSLDSSIYLWRRSDTTESDKNGVPNNNTKSQTGESDSKSSNKSNKFIEYLDRSTAFILRGHGGSVFDLAEIPSSKILLSASFDKTFRAWDLNTRMCLEVYDGHEYKIWCVCACPTTLQVITGSSDGNGCLWFLDYKRPLRIFTGHLDDVLIVKIHPSQVVIATGSADKTIRLFELVSGVCQRLFVGHNDYISCIEFNVESPNILASASGSGEIILWDMPTGVVLWTMKVTDVLLSNITWISSDVILASLSTGVILKCDITQNYNDTSKKVKGLTTRFNRLLNLKVVDNVVYTVGLPGQFTLQRRYGTKPQQGSTKDVGNESLGQRKSRASKGSSPFELFSQQHIKNNGDLVKPILELNSKGIKNQLIMDPNDTTLLTPEFFQMDVQNLPFKATPDEVAKLNSLYLSKSNDFKLFKVPPPRTKAAQKNAPVSAHQKSGKISNSLSTSTASTLQPSESHRSSNIVKAIHSDIKKKLQLRTNGESGLPNNVSSHQQPIMTQSHDGKISGAGVHQQQTQQRPKLKPVSRTRQAAKQPSKKNVSQKEQKPQNSAESNIRVSSPNAVQQPLYQQIRPNSLLTKLNAKQKLSQQQTTIRLGNLKVSQTQRFDLNTQHLAKPNPLTSPAGMPIRLSIRPHSPTVGNQTPLGGYGQLCPTSVASLLNANPGTVSSVQPVVSKTTRSRSITRLAENPKSNPRTESPQKKNHKK